MTHRMIRVVLSCAAAGMLVLASCTAGAQSAATSSARKGRTVPQVQIDRQVERALGDTVSLYKWFHANPEVSLKEVETARRLASELRALGMEVHENVGGTGVVGVLTGARSAKGPVVLVRADMDALPMTEKTGVPYASKKAGVMHACGHDIHMANAVGTLRVLKALNRQWSGTVLFIGQPAEEVGKGARDMLADEVLQNVLKRIGTPRVALAIHNNGDLPTGAVSTSPGWSTANVDSVDIVVHGVGGHGARPHRTVDPVVIGAEIVMSLQTLVARRLPPGTPAVVTVGMFAAGTKHNIISPEATLLLTVRSYSDDVREMLLRDIKTVAENVARAHNAPRLPMVTVHDDQYTPSGYNDPDWNLRLENRFKQVLGESNVRRHGPVLTGEDFARYSRTLKIPAVMWYVGGTDPEVYRRANGQGLPGTHSPMWAPVPAPTLRTGMRTMTLAILEALR